MATQRNLTWIRAIEGTPPEVTVEISLVESQGYSGTLIRRIPATATSILSQVAALAQTATAAGQAALNEYAAGNLRRDLTALQVKVLAASVEVYCTIEYDDSYGYKATQTRRIADATTETDATTLVNSIQSAAPAALGWSLGRG